jgi:hypothetical protein
MQRCSDSSWLAGRRGRPSGYGILAGLSLLSLTLAGCSATAHEVSDGPQLLIGGGKVPVTAGLAPAARLAHRFGHAYARTAYRPHPSRLPGATAAVERRIALAASRVPNGRRRLRPYAAKIEIDPRGPSTLLGRVEIADGRSPHFSIGYAIRRRSLGWRVVAISPPG